MSRTLSPRRWAAPAAVALLCACATNATKLIQTWRNPDIAAAPIQFKKVVVAAVAPTESERRSAEDAIAAKIGPKAVTSYSLMGMEEMKDVAQAKSRIAAAGADGAVVVRWVGSRDEKEIYVSPAYTPLWDHYSYSWTTWQDTTQVVNWQILQLETRIYSIADEKLIWSGTTETVEPPSVEKLIDELSAVVTKELMTQGLLQ